MTLTDTELAALAERLRPYGDVRITGTESWIAPELRGRPAVRLDLGTSRHGHSIYLAYRVGDEYPATAEAAVAAVAAIRSQHSVHARRVRAVLDVERQNQR